MSDSTESEMRLGGRFGHCETNHLPDPAGPTPLQPQWTTQIEMLLVDLECGVFDFEEPEQN